MAAVTSAVIGGISVAKGVYDTVQANKEKKRKQAELDAYQRQNLQESNPYKNIPLFTAGNDAMRDDANRNMATAMNSIGNAGTRAIIGATPKIVAEQNNVNRELQRGLEDQQMKRAYAIAGDEAQIRGMQEQRENADLAGLGNAIDVARQDANMGINTALNGAMSMAGSLGGAKGGTTTTGKYSNTFKSSNYNMPSTIGYNYKPMAF